MVRAGAVQAAVAMPVTSFQVVNRRLISVRHSVPDIRCRPGRKCEEITPCAEQKRCAWPAEWKHFMVRSRTRVGWWEFSARLLRYFDRRCFADAAVGDLVAAQLVGDDHPRHVP